MKETARDEVFMAAMLFVFTLDTIGHGHMAGNALKTLFEKVDQYRKVISYEEADSAGLVDDLNDFALDNDILA